MTDPRYRDWLIRTIKRHGINTTSELSGVPLPTLYQLWVTKP